MIFTVEKTVDDDILCSAEGVPWLIPIPSRFVADSLGSVPARFEVAFKLAPPVHQVYVGSHLICDGCPAVVTRVHKPISRDGSGGIVNILVMPPDRPCYTLDRIGPDRWKRI